MPQTRFFARCALVLLTAALVQPSMAGPVLERIKSSGTVVIAHRGSSVPFSFVDPDGKPVGYAVDLCLKVVDVLCRQLAAPELKPRFDMVAAGEADGFAMDDVLVYGLVADRPDPGKFKVVGKFLTIEPLAIMFSRDDAEFKKLVHDEMKRLIQTREAHTVYERWFLNAIPPANRSLNLPMNYLLKDFWKYPTDQVPG